MIEATENIKAVAELMRTQDNRSTSYPLFIVVESKKIYCDCGEDGRERKDSDSYINEDLCDDCQALVAADEELPDECENWQCSDTFIKYRIEKQVPNLRAGFFFTAASCDEHIRMQRHHYNETAQSYAISACYNWELKEVMDWLKEIE